MNRSWQRTQLILLHGWAMNSSCWDDCLHYLNRSCRCQSIELPGHGFADHRQSLSDRKKFIKYLYKTTPGGSVWVGWSLGGMLAQQLACHHPSHVKQLICIAANLKFLCSDDWPSALAANDFYSFAALFDNHSNQAMQGFLQLLCAPGITQSVKLRLQTMIRQSTNQPAKKNNELRRGLNCLAEHDVRTMMPTYPGTVTFIGGERDRLVSPASLHASSRIVAHGRSFIIPHAGHALILSHPRHVAQHILDCVHDRSCH